jgi:hypothetical protein
MGEKMRLLRDTLILMLAVIGCGTETKNESPKKEQSLEQALKENGMENVELSDVVMRVDENGNTTLMKTRLDLIEDQDGEADAKLFENADAEIISLSGDDDSLASSTESWGFDDDDCFGGGVKVKVKGYIKIKGKHHKEKIKFKEKFRGCENFGPTLRYGCNNIGYRPLNYYNYFGGASYFRFRPYSFNRYDGCGGGDGYRGNGYGYRGGYGYGY